MKRYPLSSTRIVAAALLLLPLMAVSCIKESSGDGGSMVEYTVTPQGSDGTGSSLPSAVKGNMKAYLFIGGGYSGMVTAGADGVYTVDYDESLGSATLVTIGASSADSLNITVPSTGDDIASDGPGIRVLPDATNGYTLPSLLYYGSTTYTKGGSAATTVTLSNQPATLRVVVKSLREVYGDGTYSIVLSGFRDRMLFNGKVTGSAISYTPPSAFDDAGRLVSGAVRTFPTMSGDHVKVSVYKSGAPLWSAETDTGGNYVTLSSGDNKVLELTCREPQGSVTLNVINWSEYAQQTVTP